MWTVSLKGLVLAIEGCPDRGVEAIDFRRRFGLPDEPCDRITLMQSEWLDVVDEQAARSMPEYLTSDADVYLSRHCRSHWLCSYGEVKRETGVAGRPQIVTPRTALNVVNVAELLHLRRKEGRPDLTPEESTFFRETMKWLYDELQQDKVKIAAQHEAIRWQRKRDEELAKEEAEKEIADRVHGNFIKAQQATIDGLKEQVRIYKLAEDDADYIIDVIARHVKELATGQAFKERGTKMVDLLCDLYEIDNPFESGVN